MMPVGLELTPCERSDPFHLRDQVGAGGGIPYRTPLDSGARTIWLEKSRNISILYALGKGSEISNEELFICQPKMPIRDEK